VQIDFSTNDDHCHAAPYYGAEKSLQTTLAPAPEMGGASGVLVVGWTGYRGAQIPGPSCPDSRVPAGRSSGANSCARAADLTARGFRRFNPRPLALVATDRAPIPVRKRNRWGYFFFATASCAEPEPGNPLAARADEPEVHPTTAATVPWAPVASTPRTS